MVQGGKCIEFDQEAVREGIVNKNEQLKQEGRGSSVSLFYVTSVVNQPIPVQTPHRKLSFVNPARSMTRSTTVAAACSMVCGLL